jgi:phosphopantetheinyl transferase
MGRAVAWASPRARVGLDLELIEPRPRSFAGTWFTDREKEALADPRASTVAWATKEAVQKVLGAGMAVSPLDIEVLAWDPAGRVEVDLHGEARTRHHNLGGGLLEIVWREDTDGHVLVQARLVA